MASAGAAGSDARAPPQAPEEASQARRAAETYAAAYRDELDEAEIIRRYVPLVKMIATHLKGRLSESVQLDDLVQAGLIAVLRIMRGGGAPAGGDAALNRSIVNAMIDEARREAWAPVRIMRLARAASQAMRAIEQRLGRHGEDEEIAAAMGIPLAQYHAALVEVAGIRLLDLDAFAAGDDERLRVAENQETALQRSRVVAALAAAIAALPEREKMVVSLYYEQELNMDEVGQVLGLDKSTICRAHGRALLMLRTALGAWNDAAAAPSSAPGG
jgi:RNA polymerase sigma factor for flagellar operon FliA